MITKETIGNFIKKLESKNPVPGGGSVAALMGSMAAALLLMAINITLAKNNSGGAKKNLAENKKKLSQLEKNLILLAEKDAQAYKKVADSFKLPKNTEKQKTIRQKNIQKNLKLAANIPLKTAVCASELGQIIKDSKKIISASVFSDAETADFLSFASFKGAIANVKINLDAIKDEKFKGKIQKILIKLRSKKQ